jgi:hypothetical protein
MNIYESLTKIMGEVPAVGKEKTNKTQNFKYRSIDDVMNAIQPLFAKYKIFLVPEILEQTREERVGSKGGNLLFSICKIRYRFYSEDGTYVDAITIGEGMDSGDKSTNKAMAAAMKYAICQVLCIPTEEIKDPDSETPDDSQPKNEKEDEEIGKQQMQKDLTKKVSEAEARVIRELMIQKGLDVEKQLLVNYQITKTEDLTKQQYASILNAIKDMPNKK